MWGCQESRHNWACPLSAFMEREECVCMRVWWGFLQGSNKEHTLYQVDKCFEVKYRGNGDREWQIVFYFRHLRMKILVEIHRGMEGNYFNNIKK